MNLLERIGVRGESFSRINLGRGVVSKVVWVLLGGLAVLGMCAYRLTEPNLLLSVAGGTLALVVFGVLRVLSFAEKNPGVALLEGAELIQWRQLEKATAKGLLSPPPQEPLLEDPDAPPSSSNDRGSAKDDEPQKDEP